MPPPEVQSASAASRPMAALRLLAAAGELLDAAAAADPAAADVCRLLVESGGFRAAVLLRRTEEGCLALAAEGDPACQTALQAAAAEPPRKEPIALAGSATAWCFTAGAPGAVHTLAVAHTAADAVGEAEALALGRITSRFAAAAAATAHIETQLATGKAHEILEQRVEQRTRDLAEAVQELEAFTYTVSHDLRAPLRAIEGFSNILLQDHGDELSGEGRRVLGVIRASILRMSTLIDDLLHLSGLGRQEMRMREVNLDALVEDVVRELAASDARAERIERGPLGGVQGDPTLLRLALFNLVENALKFTRTQDEAQIAIAREDTADGVLLCVTDNGVGFDSAYAGQMFDVFQRLHPPTQFPGTGVGLAIVKRVAERHGGSVFASSDGRGASVGFRLPHPLPRQENVHRAS